MTEPELLDLLVAEIRNNYGLHQDTRFFFKLKEINESSSEIIWFKTFDNRKDFADFYYESNFFRAAIMLKYRETGCYEIFCMGFHYFDVFDVWPDRILNSRPIKKYSKNFENTLMIPREIVERGFGEISQAVASFKSNIPV